jgi:hypothetical protein
VKVNDVRFHQRKKSSIKHIRNFDLVRILPKEENTIVDKFADDETEDLS